MAHKQFSPQIKLKARIFFPKKVVVAKKKRKKGSKIRFSPCTFPALPVFFSTRYTPPHSIPFFSYNSSSHFTPPQLFLLLRIAWRKWGYAHYTELALTRTLLRKLKCLVPPFSARHDAIRRSKDSTRRFTSA